MLDNLRRVVTGLNADGKSVVVIDGPPGNRLDPSSVGTAQLWQTEGKALDPRDDRDAVSGAFTLLPLAGGSKFLFFTIDPHDPATTTAQQEEEAAIRFAAMGAADARVDTSRHPRMHRTQTVDYIILLKGEVTLLLDEEERDLEPFDVVVQRDTNHAWINKGSEPALLAAILIDAEIV
jgi:hypothetical protein